jgi:site-specific DNA-methyltransferase (adenine-specific)
VQPASVALVVTSPPYFAGKAYEEELGEGHIPASYVDYLQMLEDVFAECVRKLEPGGRIAVNVANLGRKPYRSLASDVIAILQDRLGLLLRGEVVWQKARGAGGNCAWGSFCAPGNPVLRDLTERVVVASKGRFDRARDAKERKFAWLPHESTISADEFMEGTLDLWQLPPESATRVGHPAPFPVELPQRFIELYTWKGDVVLDPFMGSGTTAVAAVRTGRRYLGYDTDDAYVTAARRRVAAETESIARPRAKVTEDVRAALVAAGFTVEPTRPKAVAGVSAELAALDRRGARWHVLVRGAYRAGSSGLRHSDVLHRTIGEAVALSAFGERPVLVVTTALPARSSAGFRALALARGRGAFVDALQLGAPGTDDRLRAYAPGATTSVGDLLPGA